MGEGKERPEAEWDAEETDDVSRRSEEDRCRTTSEMGEGQGTEAVAMKLTIDIPDANTVMAEACPVPLAVKGIRWKESCLGGSAKLTGVYVIHHAGSIKYIGKTGSPTMSYGMRLRREFQETASSGKHIYPKLATLTVPPEIMVSFLPAKDIEKLVSAEGMSINSFEKIEIFETAAINAYKPEFQRHHITRITAHLKRLKIPNHALEAMMSVLTVKE